MQFIDIWKKIIVAKKVLFVHVEWIENWKENQIKTHQANHKASVSHNNRYYLEKKLSMVEQKEEEGKMVGIQGKVFQ